MSGDSITRRESLAILAGVAVAGPAVLRRRFRFFEGLQTEYSARAIRLVEESTVVDLLNQFRFADFAERPPKSQVWLQKPGSFTAADFATYRNSGIDVLALGQGASGYEDGVRFFADWNGFVAA